MTTWTSREAWKVLQRLWGKPVIKELSKKTPMVTIHPNEVPCFGLCQCVIRMHQNHDISNEVLSEMEKQLNGYLKQHNWSGGYMFSLDMNGAKQRADLCGHFSKTSSGRLGEDDEWIHD